QYACFVVPVAGPAEHRQRLFAGATRYLILAVKVAGQSEEGLRLGDSVSVATGGPQSSSLGGEPKRFQPVGPLTHSCQHQQRQSLTVIVLRFGIEIARPAKGLHR